MARLFLGIGVGQFAYVFARSLGSDMSFAYIGFFIGGLGVSVLFGRANRLQWCTVDNHVTRTMNVATLVLIISWGLIKLLALPSLLGNIRVIYLENAILLLSSGVFLGRTGFMWRQMRRVLMERYQELIVDGDRADPEMSGTQDDAPRPDA